MLFSFHSTFFMYREVRIEVERIVKKGVFHLFFQGLLIHTFDCTLYINEFLLNLFLMSDLKASQAMPISFIFILNLTFIIIHM